MSLDRDVLLDVLPRTAVIAPAFSGKFPRIKGEDYSPQFPLHLMSKDMNRTATRQTRELLRMACTLPTLDQQGPGHVSG